MPSQRYRRLSDLTLFITLLVVFGLLIPGSGWDAIQSSQAATFTVNSTSDVLSTCSIGGTICLRNAITAANNGDTIQFSVTGTITLTQGVLTIAKNIAITGPGATSLAVNGNAASTVFEISTGNIVSISSLTVQNGNSGVVSGIGNRGTLTLTGMIVNANLNGGGLFNRINSVMTVNYSTISNNTANGFDGGGIFNSGQLNITNSVISGNSALSSQANAGGILNDTGATLTISNSAISNNMANTDGGGIFNRPGATLNLVGNSAVSGNSASSGGGGLFNQGTLNVSNTTFSNNSAPSGGGLFQYGGTATILNSIFSNNTATTTSSFGGGIYNIGTLTVINSTFANNSTNATTGFGGGIYSNGTLGVVNSTLSGNQANAGGGIINNTGSTLTLNNSTLSGNSANTGGGLDNLGTSNLGSTIVAKNTATSSGADIQGNVISQGNNLIGNGTGSGGFVGSDQVGTTISPIDPLLNALALNAPGSAQTMSLQVGSPAIIHGNCVLTPPVTTDERSIHRKNICDVGAYETPGTPTETVGLFSPPNGQFYLKNSNAGGAQDFLFSYGPAPSSLTPLVGDWTGQGIKTPGLYDPSTGTFYLKNSNSGGNADIVFTFGAGGQGFLPIVGDWIGQGHDGVGLYKPSTAIFYLKNALSAGSADFTFQYGPPNASLMPLAGDWAGAGFATVGLYSQAGAFFYLHYCNTTACGINDTVFQYGPATSNGGAPATPLLGRWVGQINTTIGVYIPANAYFYLKNTNAAGNADNQFQFGPGPNAGWLPVMGHWSAPGPHINGTPQLGQIGGSLGFISNRNGNWSIYRLDGDEKHTQRLITLGNNPLESRPAWSPNGKQIAFVSDRDGSPSLYVMNADGSGLKRLTWNHVLNYQPSWSPDGQQIVFASNLGNSTNLYIMSADGSTVRQLTHGISELSAASHKSCSFTPSIRMPMVEPVQGRL